MTDVPTRIAIGTQKAASTYLYNLLASHPEVALSERTEVNFYHGFYEEGVAWYLNTYKTDGVKIDISPKYFMSGSVVAPRIKETLGETKPKLLLILRNPIDYLNSHFMMQQQQGFFEKSPDYDNPPTELAAFINAYPKYIERAHYHHILSTYWLTHFSLADCKIVFFEELVDEETSAAVLREIQEFWGLTPHTLSAPATSKNKALRSPFMHILKNKVIKRPWLKDFLKHQRWFHYVYQHYLTVNSTSSLSPAARKVLAQQLSADVASLEKTLGRKSPWRDFTQT